MKRATTDHAATLALFVECASDRALFLLDPEGFITTWNRGAELVTGWRAEEMIGRTHGLLYAAADITAGQPARDLAVAHTQGETREERWRVHRDGNEYLAEVTITSLHDATGAFVGYGQVIVNITDRRAAETALERSAIHLRSILATVPDPMVVIDERGTIMSFSATAEQLFGCSEIDVTGRNVSMLMPTPDRELHDSYLDRYLDTGERRIIGKGRIVVGRRRDGTEFPMHLSVGEAVSDGHRIFTGFIRDLTAQQRAEHKLQELQTELIHVSRLSAMGTMASTLAHEINQPLTAIANYLEASAALLERLEGDANVREMLHEAVTESAKEALRAGTIVRRLREFVSRGDVETRVEELPKLVEEASRLGLIGARERGVTASFDLDPAATAVVADRVQIQQVLVNLIRNAVEAMVEAPVRELRIATAPDARNMVRITVADTGPGLAPEVAANLFHAFNTTKEHGMGVGLSICRTIVEAHGGRIWADKRPGGGTVFNFTLMEPGAEDG